MVAEHYNEKKYFISLLINEEGFDIIVVYLD